MTTNKTLCIALSIALLTCALQAQAAGILDPFHNYSNPLDVNRDTLVTPFDALAIIQELQQSKGDNSVSALAESLATASLLSGGPFASPADVPPLMAWDTNADGLVSPIDALLVVQHLTQAPEPSSLVVSALGLLSFIGFLWRRKIQRA